jgi:DtxR family transcriptional regulator, Mn-dependent transcriptional regulator
VPSLTVENYVKAIFKVCQADDSQRATTGQVAAAMSVSPGTVTSMLKTLSDNGLVAYAPYEGVRLTESGNALALNILRRHRLIEMFLAKVLDLGPDEVHEEAEAMEHALSQMLVERIDAFLGHPELDSTLPAWQCWHPL